MRKLLSFLAMITYIPLRYEQHFIPFQDINQCVLADICNHTWIPECGYYENKTHYRLFTDECDLFEYNCDRNFMYKVTNYSDCFRPFECPSLPPLLTRVEGFYIYYADGRRVMYRHPPKRKMTTYYTLPTSATEATTKRTTNWKDRRRYTPQATGKYKPWSDDTTKKHACRSCMTNRVLDLPPETPHQPLGPPPKEFVAAILRAMQTTTPTTKRTTKKAKPTTQILRTGTIATVILKKMTVWRNGKMLIKVFKGYNTPIKKTTAAESDFLE